MPRRTAILIAFSIALLFGCGNARTPVSDFSQPAVPNGFRTVHYPASGISLRVPSNWEAFQEKTPLVSVVSSGTAVLSVWRYPRNSAAPAGAAALERARSRLISQAHAREASVQLIRSAAVSLDHAPGVELDTIERISGRLRRVRSTHLFLTGAEVVLEEYAPTALFHAVDHLVFSPAKRSLRLSAASVG